MRFALKSNYDGKEIVICITGSSLENDSERNDRGLSATKTPCSKRFEASIARISDSRFFLFSFLIDKQLFELF